MAKLRSAPHVASHLTPQGPNHRDYPSKHRQWMVQVYSELNDIGRKCSR